MTGHSNRRTVASAHGERKTPSRQNREREVTGQRRPDPTDRYAALITAAQRVFATKGYAGAGTDEIAQAAGVSKSLVFRHFGSKAGLFARAVTDPLLSFTMEFSAEWDSPQWATSDLEAITTHFVTTLYDRMRELRPLLIALLSVVLHPGNPTPEFDPLRAELHELFDRVAAENRKAAERFGIAGVDSQLSVRITFGLILAMVVFDGWLLDTMPRRPSRDRILTELSAFITAATGPRTSTAAPNPPVRKRPRSSKPQEPEDGRRAWGTAPEQLLQDAAAIFAERGYAATTTKEIAKRSGIAESLLFFHFPTKEELFTRAIFEPFLTTVEALTGDWDRIEWEAHPLPDTIRTFVTKLYDWMQADRPLLIAMIHSSILGDDAGPTLPHARSELKRLFDRIEIENLKARQAHGLAPLDPPLAIRATFGTLLAFTVLGDWLLAGAKPRPTQTRVRTELVDYLTAATGRPT